MHSNSCKKCYCNITASFSLAQYDFRKDRYRDDSYNYRGDRDKYRDDDDYRGRGQDRGYRGGRGEANARAHNVDRCVATHLVFLSPLQITIDMAAPLLVMTMISMSTIAVTMIAVTTIVAVIHVPAVAAESAIEWHVSTQHMHLYTEPYMQS